MKKKTKKVLTLAGLGAAFVAGLGMIGYGVVKLFKGDDETPWKEDAELSWGEINKDLDDLEEGNKTLKRLNDLTNEINELEGYEKNEERVKIFDDIIGKEYRDNDPVEKLQASMMVNEKDNYTVILEIKSTGKDGNQIWFQSEPQEGSKIRTLLGVEE